MAERVHSHSAKRTNSNRFSVSGNREGPAIASTLYTIAEISPKCIHLITEQSSRVATAFDANRNAACRQICKLVAAGQFKDALTDDFQSCAETLPESEPLDDPERIIGATLNRYGQCNSETLTRAILERLWEAGYDVRPSHF